MIVYQADKRQFLRDHDDEDIDDVIHRHYVSATGRKVSEAEVRSWRESLGFMAKVLRDDEIPDDTGLAVEFHIPQSSKRIDMTLTGYGTDGAKTAVIVELKQWDQVKPTAKDAVVMTYLAKAQREVVHPSYQAWSYATLMEGFNEAVYDGGIQLKPCAYLHNYARDGVIDGAHYEDYIQKAPLFLKGKDERAKLRDFIKQHVKHGQGADVLFELSSGRIRPSKALAESLANLLKGKPEFVLIDDQKTVYEACRAAASAAAETKPRVLIIEGGPGTGKTVVAINLLVALTKLGLLGKYVSKNAAPRRVYEAKVTGSMRRSHFANMFTGSGAFINGTPNAFDFLVVDEAHRLNEKSGLYGNLGENQVKEIITAAKCAIFFIDEDQRVTLQDIGSKALIQRYAAEQGAVVEHFQLASQFRCNGSDGYLAWLDNTLDIRETANPTLDGSNYEFRVFDDPVALHEAIEARNTQNKARVVAGYCWPWLSKRNPAAYDIEIGPTYKRRWNLDQDGSLWIIAPNSVQEVGCIHTCQGLEVDYIGVIIGPDLLVRNGRIVTNALARDRHDKSLKGLKRWMHEDSAGAEEAADVIIKNTYRTLMTRGMKGCFVYSTDAETLAYFKKAC
ncbi:DNA/RNA helicase domain-containing protein [Comamonas odontotermitis]|uniref:DNA/RNA helicase domain-containing protein n=1 Tax=Comamonas odontotermitis TaxID=379895 RepID=UPI0037505A6B